MSSVADKLRVLVVDDSKTIRRVLEALLTKAQCEVVTTQDGFDALAKVVDVKPDIILVDIMMPKINGYELCALIKNNRSLNHTPIILVSSKDGLFDMARGRIVGCDGYLTKPFSKQNLLDIIKKISGV